MNPLTVYIGYDRREKLAYDVAKFSIERRSSKPVITLPIGRAVPGVCERKIEWRGEQMWCPISDAPMATEFAITRFAVPFITTHGWALFVDCDVVCLEDIADLFALADDKYAVMVVKHQQEIKGGLKMDGQIQTAYPRKNWSSVVLWNCGHEANRELTKWRLNNWPGRDLHAFKWLKDEEIGELPKQWNMLVGVNDINVKKTGSRIEGEKVSILHFTLGGPWLSNWKGGALDHVWLREKEALDGTKKAPGHK